MKGKTDQVSFAAKSKNALPKKGKASSENDMDMRMV